MDQHKPTAADRAETFAQLCERDGGRVWPVGVQFKVMRDDALIGTLKYYAAGWKYFPHQAGLAPSRRYHATVASAARTAQRTDIVVQCVF